MTSRAIGKRRETITSLPLYFNGQIQKKTTAERGFNMYHGELRGSTMFFYTDEKQETYCERLELNGLKSMTPMSSYLESTTPVYTLKFSNKEVQLKTDNPDTGEMWRGYILTVANLKVPSGLQLLPGQYIRLNEVQIQEQERRAQPSAGIPPSMDVPGPRSNTPNDDSEYDSTLSLIPSCYMSVSREEAEKLLEENPDYGSIILRPATDQKNYSITMRQVFPSGPVMKNYKVLSTATGFCIQLDKPVTVETLGQVVDHFMERTGYELQPFVKPQAYDTRIELPPPAVAPKPKVIPKARVAPTIHTQPGNKPPAWPLPATPPLQKQQSQYMNEEYLKKDCQANKKKGHKPASRS